VPAHLSLSGRHHAVRCPNDRYGDDGRGHDLWVLFGTRGQQSACWCQRYKSRGREWDSGSVSVPVRARRLRDQTRCGTPEADATSGLVAYLDGEPVGWCAVEPRSTYLRLGTTPWTGRAEDKTDDGIWAVTCFVTRS
jgi:hypothetical protein